MHCCTEISRCAVCVHLMCGERYRFRPNRSSPIIPQHPSAQLSHPSTCRAVSVPTAAVTGCGSRYYPDIHMSTVMMWTTRYAIKAKPNVWLYFSFTLIAKMYGNLTGIGGAFIQFLSLCETNICTVGRHWLSIFKQPPMEISRVSFA